VLEGSKVNLNSDISASASVGFQGSLKLFGVNGGPEGISSI